MSFVFYVQMLQLRLRCFVLYVLTEQRYFCAVCDCFFAVLRLCTARIIIF